MYDTQTLTRQRHHHIGEAARMAGTPAAEFHKAEAERLAREIQAIKKGLRKRLDISFILLTGGVVEGHYVAQKVTVSKAFLRAVEDQIGINAEMVEEGLIKALLNEKGRELSETECDRVCAGIEQMKSWQPEGKRRKPVGLRLVPKHEEEREDQALERAHEA